MTDSLIVFWGGLFSTSCVKEVSLSLLIYSIFNSSKKNLKMNQESKFDMLTKRVKLHAVFK